MDDAEIRELQDEVRRLQNSVHRLTSMVQKEDVHEKKETNKDRKREDRDDDDERERGREKSKKRWCGPCAFSPRECPTRSWSTSFWSQRLRGKAYENLAAHLGDARRSGSAIE